MVTRYEAFMDGVPLSSIAPEIIVLDIVEKEAKNNQETYTMASGGGSRYFRSDRESLTVSVKVEIHAYGVQRRQDIMEQIHLWMKGKYLSVNTRPGKRLAVRVESAPVVPSALKWTQEITMNFVSRETPFWESDMPTRLIMRGTSGNGFLRPAGTVEEVPMELHVLNTGSGVMGRFMASVRGKEIVFENLGLEQGDEIKLEYVDGVQFLPVEKRTAESADDLFVKCNEQNEVHFEADQEAEVTFIARGRYI